MLFYIFLNSLVFIIAIISDSLNPAFQFDFTSVTMLSFHEYNKLTLNDLTTANNWDNSKYSIVRTGDATLPIWANKYRASTQDKGLRAFSGQKLSPTRGSNP